MRPLLPEYARCGGAKDDAGERERDQQLEQCGRASAQHVIALVSENDRAPRALIQMTLSVTVAKPLARATIAHRSLTCRAASDTAPLVARSQPPAASRATRDAARWAASRRWAASSVVRSANAVLPAIPRSPIDTIMSATSTSTTLRPDRRLPARGSCGGVCMRASLQCPCTTASSIERAHSRRAARQALARRSSVLRLTADPSGSQAVTCKPARRRPPWPRACSWC